MPVTPKYSIPYPDATSTYAPLETWFQGVAEGVEAALGASLGGLIPPGTTAQRNTLYGTPVTATDRVTLANKPARWFNIEKGWEEQYFAAYNDAGVSATTPVRMVAGWAPSAATGSLVPIRPTSVAASGGTVTRTSFGATFSGTTTCSLNGVFSDDFTNYKIVHRATHTGGSTPQDFMRLRASGVDAVTAYNWRRMVATTSNVVSSAAGASVAQWDSMASEAFSNTVKEFTIFGPYKAATTMLQGQFTEDNGAGAIAVGQYYGSHNTASQYDGFTIYPNSGSFTGTLEVYGMVNG